MGSTTLASATMVGMAKMGLLHNEGSKGSKSNLKAPADLKFTVEEQTSFNVLMVRTPDLPLLQGQVATGARMLWQDTVDLMGAVGRMGLPHTTLQSKCAYYDKELFDKPQSSALMGSHLKRVVSGVQSGTMHQHLHKEVPRSHPPIADIPVMRFVVASNLLCYWMISSRADRTVRG